MIDVVALHIKQAPAHAKKSGIPLASIVQGDARAVALPAAFADVVLLLGPLYHLVEKEDRLLALQEAHRLLKRGGLLFAAAVSRYAPFMDGLRSGAFGDAMFRQIVRTDLSTGRHQNPTSSPEYVTTAYFHRPDELQSEISDANFDDVRLFGIEGPAWGAAQLGAAFHDPEQRKVLLEMLSESEGEPSIIGASAHFLAVALRA